MFGQPTGHGIRDLFRAFEGGHVSCALDPLEGGSGYFCAKIVSLVQRPKPVKGPGDDERRAIDLRRLAALVMTFEQKLTSSTMSAAICTFPAAFEQRRGTTQVAWIKSAWKLPKDAERQSQLGKFMGAGVAIFAARSAAQQLETDVRAGTSARMAAIHFKLQPEALSELSTATRQFGQMHP
ncbi:hypothetical protein [Methylobacterium sp. CM6257]